MLSPLPLAAVIALVSIALTGALAFGLSLGVSITQPVPYSFWLDVTKTAIGAFLGAGFAFASALCIQWAIRFSEHVKSGNLALSALVQQFNDLLALKQSFLRQQTTALANRPDCPLWLQFLPSQYGFTEDYADPSSLAFLFDKEGTDTIQKVIRVQQLHRRLRSLVDEHGEVRVLIQQRQAEQGIKPFDKMPMAEIEEKIGPYLLARATSAADALLKKFADDEAEYESAFGMLRAELRRRFGKRFIDMGTPKHPRGVSRAT